MLKKCKLCWEFIHGAFQGYCNSFIVAKALVMIFRIDFLKVNNIGNIEKALR